MHRHLCSSGILIRLISGCLAAVVLAISGSQQEAAAQQPQALTVEAFSADPGLALQRSPSGGAILVSVLRDFAVSDRTTLQPILNLLASANASQKSAIGAALAQAAKIVVRTNPAYAGQIQQAVVQTKDQDVVIAYTAVTGDVAIGATGGIGGGLGGGSGGPTNLVTTMGTGGAADRLAATPITTSLFSITSSISSGGGISGGSAASSVSP